MGSASHGVTANFMFHERGTFWVLLLTYFYLPKSAREYLFPDLSNFITFAAAPLVLTPFVRNQDSNKPTRAQRDSDSIGSNSPQTSAVGDKSGRECSSRLTRTRLAHTQEEQRQTEQTEVSTMQRDPQPPLKPNTLPKTDDAKKREQAHPSAAERYSCAGYTRISITYVSTIH